MVVPESQTQQNLQSQIRRGKKKLHYIVTTKPFGLLDESSLDKTLHDGISGSV